MGKVNVWKILFCVSFVICLASCRSNKGWVAPDNGVMYAMIYDYDNIALSGVLVKINGKELVKSDMQGRFILEFDKKGEYKIELTKQGYEKLEQTFYYDPLEVLYFKMITPSQLLALAEQSLDEFDYAEAESYIERAYILQPMRGDIIYFKAVVLYLQGEYTAAQERIQELKEKGFSGKYIELLDEKISEKMKKN